MGVRRRVCSARVAAVLQNVREWGNLLLAAINAAVHVDLAETAGGLVATSLASLAFLVWYLVDLVRALVPCVSARVSL